MVQSYQTDEEQIEAIKTWWQENGKSTVISIVVVLAGVFGWKGYQEQQQLAAETASEIYQNLLISVTIGNGVLSSEQRATANHLADTLKNDFSSSAYASFAAFYKAKLAIGAEDLDLAGQELNWVLTQGGTAEVINQAHLRLARVLYAQEKYDQALLQLSEDANGYAASYAEVKGDIYIAMGEQEKAALAYQKSSELTAQTDRPTLNPLLKMKIDQLDAQMKTKSNNDTTVITDSEEGA